MTAMQKVQLGDGRDTLPSIKIEEELKKEKYSSEIEEVFDAVTYYRESAGRLVVDPQLAKVEFGEVVAAKLKLTEDGSMVLWPQPSDDPNDPQNWSDRRKTLYLIIITMAAFVPDFDSAIGIAALFGLAQQFDTTTGVINNLTSNWSIFLIGWGGIVWVILARRFGRLPVLFWTQLLALGFLIGATFAPNLPTFAAMRCLTAFFWVVPPGHWSVRGHRHVSISPSSTEAQRVDVGIFSFTIHFPLPIWVSRCKNKLEMELWHRLHIQHYRPCAHCSIHG